MSDERDIAGPESGPDFQAHTLAPEEGATDEPAGGEAGRLGSEDEGKDVGGDFEAHILAPEGD